MTSVHLPAFPALSDQTFEAIAQRHGIHHQRVRRLPERGIFNAIFALGELHVVRIPRDHPAHLAALVREVGIVPAARQAGVHTPELVAFDDACDLLSVPYIVYERVRGRDLARLRLEPPAAANVWRDLGADLARLHYGVDLGDALPDHEPVADPRDLVERRASGGWFTASEARWLTAWLDRLAQCTPSTPPRRCLHGDSQATNVMVRLRNGQPGYIAVIDWGSAGWGDPAFDFAGVPLRAVPHMLAGYRTIKPVDDDQSAEARILWRHLQLAMYLVGRGPLPNWSWAERPLPMLLEIFRFFSDGPSGVWRSLAPPRPT
jgi:aminoglycoside phosphotransferase (APT) family kinase protein